MASPSKIKGKTFERKVCQILSETFQVPFLRVPTSGAFTGGKNIHRMSVLEENQRTVLTGDIIPPAPYDVINFECKHYKTFPWQKILKGKTPSSLFDNWIKEAAQAVPQYKQTWFLIFKTDRHPEIIVYPETFASVWKGAVKELHTYTTKFGLKVLFCLLEDFLKANKDYIIQFCQKIAELKVPEVKDVS